MAFSPLFNWLLHRRSEEEIDSQMSWVEWSAIIICALFLLLFFTYLARAEGPWKVFVSTGGSCGAGCQWVEGTFVQYEGKSSFQVYGSTDGAYDMVEALNEAHERRTVLPCNLIHPCGDDGIIPHAPDCGAGPCPP